MQAQRSHHKHKEKLNKCISESDLTTSLPLSSLTSSFTAQETEDIERPRKRRRRNSDSSLYCKAMGEKVGESKSETQISLEEKTKYLDSEREEFVQCYLHSIPETHSMTTETSNSGIRTHGAPSDLDEMVNVTGKYNSLS